MGSWTIWHVLGFMAIAAFAIWRANAQPDRHQLSGYGGWLIVYSVFAIFWAAQELAEYYRIRSDIEILVPSALENQAYRHYSNIIHVLSWLEAGVLVVCALLPAMKNKRSLLIKLACLGLWVAGPIAAFAEFVLAEIYVGDFLLEEDYSTIGATLLFTTLWTWYFMTSFRVRNTYKA